MAVSIGPVQILAGVAFAAATLVPAAACAADLPALGRAPAPDTVAGDPSTLPALPLDEQPGGMLLGVVASGEAFERASLCLTQAIYYEAGFEPRAGQEAVAQVVINRLKSPRFPKSVCGVVFQGAERAAGCQFSFACDGSLARRPEAAAWAQAQEVAVEALQGTPVDRVGASTHYHASWMKPYWQASMQETTRIGGHIFYQAPDAAAAPHGAPVQYAGVEPDRTLPPGPGPEVARYRVAAPGSWTIIAPRAPHRASSSGRRTDVALLVPRGWRPEAGR